MKFDFYYGEESEQYSFYSVPKMFFDNDKFKDLSAMSKLLYSFLLDRMSLSQKRNWIDDKNRAYIKYSLKAICNDNTCFIITRWSCSDRIPDNAYNNIQ